MAKISSEKTTVERMINLYCRKRHGNKVLCPECEELKEYALKRLDKCTFGDDKPTCKECKVHCYKPEKRDKIRKIMRFSGPRMLLYDPLGLLRHKFS